MLVSKRLTLDVIKTSVKKENPSFPTRLIESFLVIWLDEQGSDQYRSEQTYLSKRIYQFQTFEQREACLNYVQTIYDERIYLILSNTTASDDDYRRMAHLEKIYRYELCATSEKHNERIFRDIDSLWNQMQEDMNICRMDFLPMTITHPFNREIHLSSTYTLDEARFLFGQAVREVIYRLKFETGSKDVFLDFCRTHYKHHDRQLEQIEDFTNNYRPNKALSWLIEPSFISRILQRAQRTSEIDILYKLGFYVKQVNLQLARLFEENRCTLPDSITVYRGKTMTKAEFDHLMEHADRLLVSFNVFMIGSTRKETAMNFLRHRLELHPQRIAILFQIDIDVRSNDGKFPFAVFKETHQICFDLNTVFHLISIEELTDTSPSIYLMKLKIAHDDDPDLTSFQMLLRVDELHANPLPFLAKLLMDAGEYRRAEQCFFALLQDPSVLSQPRRLARVHKGLAGTYMHRGDYGKALEHYQKTLETSLIYLPPDHADLISIYQSIGDSYWNDGSFLSAVQAYERVIVLADKSQTSNQSEALAEIRRRVNKIREAMSEKD